MVLGEGKGSGALAPPNICKGKGWVGKPRQRKAKEEQRSHNPQLKRVRILRLVFISLTFTKQLFKAFSQHCYADT